MAMALGTRLTLWYAALLLVALAAFSGTVLWLHWELTLHQADESLEAIGRAASNVLDSELAEDNTIGQAARQVVNVAHQKDYALAVLDDSGTPLSDAAESVPFPLTPVPAGRGAVTLTNPQGRAWRVLQRAHESRGHRFSIAIAMPLHEVEEQWQVLARACALGVPFVMLAAAAGGWWLGRHGLRPLATIADQARAITAQQPDARLSIADAGPELDAVATAFNSVLERLGSALTTQRRFMADASHELRTPLSVIRTAADVTLAQRHRDEEEYREALTAVSQQSTRLARLVDDMFVLARADGGGYPITRTDVDVDALVQECVDEFRTRARAKDIHLTSRLQPATMTGDAALLRRLLANLIGNALFYAPGGSTVEVTLRQEAGAINLRVADNGPGIPLEDRERVFERFVRLDPARHEGGAGLGLSIARWIAEVHRGHLELLPRAPAGCVFSATFPL